MVVCSGRDHGGSLGDVAVSLGWVRAGSGNRGISSVAFGGIVGAVVGCWEGVEWGFESVMFWLGWLGREVVLVWGSMMSRREVYGVFFPFLSSLGLVLLEVPTRVR